MPRPVNSIQITGTLTDIPKVTVVDKDDKPLKIVNFSIAFDWWHGKKLPKAWFFNCTAFGYAADAAEKFLNKGKRIMITDAYLQPSTYMGKDGTKKKDFKIIVNDFMLLAYNEKADGAEVDAVMKELDDVDEVPY